jgi:hypoxia up-regulated 1
MAPAASRLGVSNLSAILCLFWIFSSTALAASAVVGIDFGTEYIKAALVMPGIPLEIVLTKDSRRKETSAVAFKPLRSAAEGSYPERLYGSDAVALAARFPGDVYPNLKAILGLPFDNSKVQEYGAQHPALQLVKDEIRGTAAFRSGAFGKDEEAFLVEEILAMELQSIQKNAEAVAGKGSYVKDAVLTVPPYFTAEETRAIELAANLAGLRVLSLISDGLAVGVNYATTRTFPSVTEGGKPEHHLVFDMGAGSTKATVLRFQGKTVKDGKKSNKTVQEVHVLGTGWDRTLGGDALNTVIVNDMIESFAASKGAKAASIQAESVKAHGRTSAKLFKEAERLRQVLSANAETQASFEGLYEDIDFKYKLTRANFEKLAESYALRVSPAIGKALERANLEIKDLDSIILHGGAVRTPFIQYALENIIGDAEKIRSNVNADEAAVFGAAFKAASLSPSFRVKEIRTYEAAEYAVGMKWTNINDKQQHQRIYTPQSHLGQEKVVSFQNQKDFFITFYQHVDSSENVTPGSAEKGVLTMATRNLTASVAEAKEKHGCADGDILAKFGVRLNTETGEVEITKGALQCEVEEDEKKGGIVEGVKDLFGLGGKKSDQDIFKDSDIVSDASASTESSSSTSTSKSTSKSKTSSASSTSSSAAVADEKLKPTKRLVAIPLDFSVEKKGYPALPAKVLTAKKDRLVALAASDKARRQREEALNQLEAFAYKIRDILNIDSFVAASAEAERKTLEENAEAASEWIYGDGADAAKEAFKEKLKELQALVAPITKRQDEASKRAEHIQLFRERLNQTAQFIETVKGTIEKAAEEELSSKLASKSSTSTTSTTTAAEPSSSTGDFDGLEDGVSSTTASATTSATPEPAAPSPVYKQTDLEELTKLYKTTNEWFEKILKEQEALPSHVDPVLWIKDLSNKSHEMSKFSYDMISKAYEHYVPPKSSSSKKPKSSKTKKAKKPKSTATAETVKGDETKTAEEKPKATFDFDDNERATFMVGEDGKLPNEEDVRAAFKEFEEKAAKKEKEEKKGHVGDEL